MTTPPRATFLPSPKYRPWRRDHSGFGIKSGATSDKRCETNGEHAGSAANVEQGFRLYGEGTIERLHFIQQNAGTRRLIARDWGTQLRERKVDASGREHPSSSFPVWLTRVLTNDRAQSE
jgi:hypothetical protein